jgi:hypothetical protein
MFNIFTKLYNLFSGISETTRTFRNIRKNNNWICMEDGGYVADDEKSPKSGDMGDEGDEGDEVMGEGEAVLGEGEAVLGEGEAVLGEGDEVMVDGLELILLKALKI